MSEIKVSVNIENIDWLEYVRDYLAKYSLNMGETLFMASKGYAVMSISVQEQFFGELYAKLKESITELFTSKQKYDYISARLLKMNINKALVKMLTHALVGFDKDSETEILQEQLSGISSISLDGFARFRLQELYERWDEICEMAIEHSAYLSDDSIMNELLRFFIDAAKKSNTSVDIYKCNEEYRMVEHTDNIVKKDITFNSFEDLLCNLIDIAPCETRLTGFEKDDYYLCLNTIFDAKLNILQ